MRDKTTIEDMMFRVLDPFKALGYNVQQRREAHARKIKGMVGTTVVANDVTWCVVDADCPDLNKTDAATTAQPPNITSTTSMLRPFKRLGVGRTSGESAPAHAAAHRRRRMSASAAAAQCGSARPTEKD